MNDEQIEEKIYTYLDKQDIKADSEIAHLENQICELNDQVELMIPPDCYKQYKEVTSKQEELRFKRDFLNFRKIYKEALKEGLLVGLDLNIGS